MGFKRLSFTSDAINALRDIMPMSYRIECSNLPWLLFIYKDTLIVGSITKSMDIDGRIKYTRSPITISQYMNNPFTNKMYTVYSYTMEQLIEELYDYVTHLELIYPQTSDYDMSKYTIRPSKYDRVPLQ